MVCRGSGLLNVTISFGTPNGVAKEIQQYRRRTETMAHVACAIMRRGTVISHEKIHAESTRFIRNSVSSLS
jgi:hypothetical protein